MEKTTINWYPGHMAKSLREIEEIASVSDLIIYILDARSPFITINKSMQEMFKHKEQLYIFSKADLRDNNKDQEVISKINSNNYMFANLTNHVEKKKIIQKIKQLTKEKIARMKTKGLINYKVKVFVVGLPNVGKSTLINLLIGKRKLKAENYPGVTKRINWVNIDNIFLLDTPGIMPMKINTDDEGFMLVFMQIIKQSIVHKMLLFRNVIQQIWKQYPQYLIDLGFQNFDDPSQIDIQLNQYAKQNSIDLNQSIEKIIIELRTKKMTFL